MFSDVDALLLTLLFALLPALTASLGPLSASATLVNVTIDDTFGDESNGSQVVYEPDDAWSAGQTCAACTAHPDSTLARNGTWHDGTTQANSTQLLTAAVRFEGVAVYVYCIVTRSSTSPDGNSDMTFFLDGDEVGQFVRPPDGNATYEYNVPVYVNQSLAAGAHELAIVNGHLLGNKSLILLDYIVYTRDVDPISSSLESLSSALSLASSTSAFVATTTTFSSFVENTDPPSSTQKRTIIIAVATVCAVLGLAAAIVTISYFCLRKRYRNYDAPPEGASIPRSPPHIEVNPATSGWAQGTWAADGEDQPHPSLAKSPTARRAAALPLSLANRISSGKRHRAPADAVATASHNPLATLSPTKTPIVPPSILHGIPTFRISPSQTSQSRADPPGSPASSSWGTPASMAPDSATYLIPPSDSSSTSHVNLDRAFSEVSGSANTLTSHSAHPFAKARAVQVTQAPLARTRSDGAKQPASGPPTSTSKPPPSSMPASFTTRPRGNSASKTPFMTDPLLSGTTSPTTPPSAPYTTQTVDTDESFLPSPSPADPSPLSFPLSRIPLPDKPSLRPSASASSRQRRKPVDPVDPSLQPPREPASGRDVQGEGEGRARPPGSGTHAHSQSEPSLPRPTGTTLFQRQRDRRRFGFVDVPVDAANSRPSSYRESG
ncbi:hypothetical protein BD414DRAFT_490726 [Trametes punicea]|nr:hypothetical protein BD414DRAFT_490726 [Trametes punicea]